MSLKKDTGIVLHAKVFSDSDVIFTLLGESQAKARYVVKGIKKSKRRPILACEQGSQIRIDYYHHLHREVYNIKELHLINRFEVAKKGYDGFLLVSYLCDLVQAFLPDGDVYQRCYKILHAAFSYLQAEQYLPILLPFFKVRLLAEIGLISQEFFCHSCGIPVLEMAEPAVHLEAWNFEITCSNCNAPPNNHIHILHLLDILFQSKYKTLLTHPVPLPVIIELDRALNTYIQAYLNRHIKSHALLYQTLGNSYELYR
ncbi:MAG: DNA repair protein RecO [Spirochaetota bacterium]